jgi:hypothetical protein
MNNIRRRSYSKLFKILLKLVNKDFSKVYDYVVHKCKITLIYVIALPIPSMDQRPRPRSPPSLSLTADSIRPRWTAAAGGRQCRSDLRRTGDR